MREALVEQGPVGALREMQHSIVILRIACRLRCCEEPVIKRCEGPLFVKVRLGNLHLPVADLLHRGVDGLWLYLSGEICGERTRIVWRIANVRTLHRRRRSRCCGRGLRVATETACT